MNPKELAWAAGFFDGEGCTAIHRSVGQGPATAVRMIISQADRRVLDRFRDAVGVGAVAGPRKHHRSNRKPIWEWRATAWADVQVVYALLWKFLSPVKREQVQKCVTAVRTPAWFSRRNYRWRSQ